MIKNLQYVNMVETLINGNISDFNKWVKSTSKKQLLKAIMFYTQAGHGTSEEITVRMIKVLEKD